MIRDIEWNNLKAVMERYGIDVAARYRQRLDADGRVATGRLKNSVRPFLKTEGDIFTECLELEDYWKYFERGTRLQGPFKRQGIPPGRPMRKAILDWIRVKGVRPKYRMSNGKFPTPKTMAYFIARKIYKVGTPPYGYLEKSLGNRDVVTELCRQAMREDINEWIEGILQDVGAR